MTTPQTQAALLISLKDSDFWPADMSLNKWADLVCDELRRLDAENQRLQALLAKLQPAQEPAQAGELPDEREAFERWWRQRQLLTFPKDYDQGRLDGWGSAYKPAAMEAWQAALAARKPLTDERPVAMHEVNDIGFVPVVLKPFTPAQRRRLWVNSPEHHKDASSITGFERIVTLTERAHGIGGNHADQA